MKLSVITPVWNEKECIKDFVRVCSRVYADLIEDDEIEHIVVDDGSTDGTGGMLKEFRHLKHLKVITLCGHRGMNIALKCGLEEARGKYVLLSLAADLQDDPRAVLRMLEELEFQDAIRTSYQRHIHDTTGGGTLAITGGGAFILMEHVVVQNLIIWMKNHNAWVSPNWEALVHSLCHLGEMPVVRNFRIAGRNKRGKWCRVKDALGRFWFKKPRSWYPSVKPYSVEIRVFTEV